MNVFDFLGGIDINRGSWLINYMLCEDCTVNYICEKHAQELKEKLQKEVKIQQ